MPKSETAVIRPADLLRDLIRCPSVTPEQAGVFDVLEAALTPLGFDCTRVTFDGDGSYEVANLFATRHRPGPHLLFAGHTDVVPPGNEAAWTHPPFAAETDNDQIWGRGAVDMKSGIAAFVAAVSQAVADGSAEKGTISLAITNDEEADAVNGTGKLLAWAAAAGHRFDFALVGEPSSAQNVGDGIKIGRRGSLNGRITVSGIQGHVAYPERARNPLPALARLATALNAEPLDDGSEHFQPSNFELTSIDVGNPTSNVIPASGSFRFNIRFNDHWTPESLTRWLEARIEAAPLEGCGAELEILGRPSTCFLSPVGAEVMALSDVIAAVAGRVPVLSTGGGTSDARFIAEYCPVVECGLVGTTMHQVDERVPLADLDRLARIYHGFVTRFFA